MSPRAFKSIGAGAAAKKLRDEAKKEFAKDHAGAHNAGKEIWLPANTEIQDLSISIADAQILESLKQSSNQIAAMYGVPAFKATGDTTTSKFNSIEQIQLDFKQNVSAITSMYRREFESKLLTEGDKNNEVSIESNEDILISPDTKTKGEYMKTLFMTGSISPKTIATIANQPSEGLSDETYIPVNMQSVRVYEAKNKNPQPEPIVEPSQTKKDTKPKSNEDE
jgi:HK97 family phage portal protein